MSKIITIQSNHNTQPQLPAVDLLCEIVPGDGCFGHIPALPGLCFRGEDPSELQRTSPDQIKKYIEWLIIENLSDLNPLVIGLMPHVDGSYFNSIHVVIKEIVAGSPVWISGNPAVLFNYDLHPMKNPEVLAYLQFTGQVLKHIGHIIESLSRSQLLKKPDSESRSSGEILTHIGNCVWWYCSRLDDSLPEPDDVIEETPLHRIDRLFDHAKEYLISVPQSLRKTVHVPSRYQTNDPLEKWTHTKTCRRQAEHAWEHLGELMQILSQDRKSD